MSLNFANNLEELAEEIGKWKGMADGISQPDYMDELISAAFVFADDKFNMEASLMADDFDFAHMYEYGTRGVGEPTGENGGLDPMKQSSRLWKSFTVGGGGRKLITFSFLPANQPNPPKTEENTGITDSRVDFDKLQVNNGVEYVWWSKAETVEKNLTVFVKLKDANLLFVPIQEQPAGTNNTDNERGYTFRKTHASRPGQWLGGAGKFSLYFTDWWSDQGAVHMETEMMEQFNRDVAKFNKKPKKRGLKPAETVSVNGVAEATRGKTRKQWELSAQGLGDRVRVA